MLKAALTLILMCLLCSHYELYAQKRMKKSKRGAKRAKKSKTIKKEGFWPRFSQMMIDQLTGVEVSYYAGSTKALSHIGDGGNEEVVASGDQKISGFSASIYNPKRGFYLSFYPSFITQRISISDFAKDVPITHEPGKDSIPAVITDFASGHKMDSDLQNVYDLDFFSLHLVAAVGYLYSTRCKSRMICFYLEGRLASHLLDSTWMMVDVGKERFDGYRFNFWQSLGYGINSGLRFPKVKMTLDVGYLWFFSPEMQLPDNVEFQGPIIYDQSNNIFKRSRILVNMIEFSSQVYSVTVGYKF